VDQRSSVCVCLFECVSVWCACARDILSLTFLSHTIKRDLL
jgi:hypothetical protein